MIRVERSTLHYHEDRLVVIEDHSGHVRVGGHTLNCFAILYVVSAEKQQVVVLLVLEDSKIRKSKYDFTLNHIGYYSL
jgi:hypothetical protein